MATGQNRGQRAAIQQLESLMRAGVGQLPKRRQAAASRPTEPTSNAERATPAEPDRKAAQPAARTPGLAAGVRPAATADTLELIRADVAACSLCSELARSRTQTVFGVGNPHARLCFLGEAPGADEDRQGEPFVGAAGQLLNKIIEACRMKREEVYILNVLKCRPPGNRNPTPTEAGNCRSFLDRQLALIQPEFLCCLGAIAAQNLLSMTVPIGKMRGKFHDYRGIRVMCTYHPAYLLRNPAAKGETWKDMKMLMRAMGVELG